MSFSFGKNWSKYIEKVDEERINAAMTSLRDYLGDLHGKSFLDIGCGSGLFSLAAHRMGARVVSIDVDPDCVQCAHTLRERFSPGATNWEIAKKSILNEEDLLSLAPADVVYSWGVLHHTGQMETAIWNAAKFVKPTGLLNIAIYNDQGLVSRYWRTLKRIYNQSPPVFQFLIVIGIAGFFEARASMGRLIRGQNPIPPWIQKSDRRDRGMSVWHDWVDWCGGYPFEVATPEKITRLVEPLGFKLKKLKTVGTGWGCNEFVFVRKGE